MRQELGREGKQKQLEQAGSEQATEFADPGVNSKILQDSNLAEPGSIGPVEDVSDSASEDFENMNRGVDVMAE
jgi:hypothetical protein